MQAEIVIHIISCHFLSQNTQVVVTTLTCKQLGLSKLLGTHSLVFYAFILKTVYGLLPWLVLKSDIISSFFSQTTLEVHKFEQY